MKELLSRDFSILFSNLCCSQCRNDFTQNDLKIKSIKDGILICNLSCTKCGKDFGEIILNINKKSKKHFPLEVVDGPAVINYDDVIDAHNYIKKMK